MKLADPRPLLEEIDLNRLDEFLHRKTSMSTKKVPVYLEPGHTKIEEIRNGSISINGTADFSDNIQSKRKTGPPIPSFKPSPQHDAIRGKVQRLGDFIDTDAVSSSSLSPILAWGLM